MMGGVAIMSSALAATMASPAPLLLYPITPSLPPGLYVRTGEPPAVGLIAAFPVPEAAWRYKAEIDETVHHDFLFMKPIVAGPGDHVCMQTSDMLFINGLGIAAVTPHDSVGRPLPVWRGCRRLDTSEVFTLSSNVSNSFDSRHYGPINKPNRASAAMAGTERFIDVSPLQVRGRPADVRMPDAAIVWIIVGTACNIGALAGRS
jgi:type IV secretory pathway protease TraF